MPQKFASDILNFFCSLSKNIESYDITLSTTQNCLSSGVLLAFSTSYFFIVGNSAGCLTSLLLRYNMPVAPPVIVTIKHILPANPTHVPQWPLGRRTTSPREPLSTEKETIVQFPL